MADYAGDLIDGMREMRIRQALFIHALRQIGGELEVTRGDVYDTAKFDVHVAETPAGFSVSLKVAG